MSKVRRSRLGHKEGSCQLKLWPCSALLIYSSPGNCRHSHFTFVGADGGLWTTGATAEWLYMFGWLGRTCHPWSRAMLDDTNVGHWKCVFSPCWEEMKAAYAISLPRIGNTWIENVLVSFNFSISYPFTPWLLPTVNFSSHNHSWARQIALAMLAISRKKINQQLGLPDQIQDAQCLGLRGLP